VLHAVSHAQNLGIGMKRAVSDLRKAGGQQEADGRTDQDLPAKFVFGGICVVFVCMVLLYTYFLRDAQRGIVAALVMLVLGFFFRRRIRESGGHDRLLQHPVSGLTLYHAAGGRTC